MAVGRWESGSAGKKEATAETETQKTLSMTRLDVSLTVGSESCVLLDDDRRIVIWRKTPYPCEAWLHRHVTRGWTRPAHAHTSMRDGGAPLRIKVPVCCEVAATAREASELPVCDPAPSACNGEAGVNQPTPAYRSRDHQCSAWTLGIRQLCSQLGRLSNC